ncbi:MAG TPA: hypothetical protein VHD33_08555, partial [Legionellaceae bacterium]|nr:hypothetical protein [Legionellaceae bacterium]
ALSWMSGYFINQMFTPLIFYYQGAMSAGQIGVCLALMNMLGLFAITWITVRSPQMGHLAARNENLILERVFYKAFYQSIGIFSLGGFGICILLYLLRGHAIMTRFLSEQEIVILLCAYFFVHMIGALSLYLRAHKKELFTPLSIIGAVLQALFAWYGAFYYGTVGVCWSILIVNAFYGFPSACWLWVKFRNTRRDEKGKESDVFEAYH